MKCDELTPIELECNMGKDSVTGLVNREPWKAYDIDEVDAAIAELKSENKMLKEHIANGDVSRITWIDEATELKAENEQLKAKLENVQASAYADSVDAGMRERRLRRALWLLKTRYFWILMVYASDLAKLANPSIIHKSNFLENPTPRCMEEYQHEAELYDNARIKCLKKAEEYK